ncbi:MAG TPA: class I SAM-dependent methyltransferase [Thermoleophilaceae bacterium]
MSAACAACSSTVLVPHMQVAGEAGEAGLIPTTDRFGSALSDVVRCLACGHMQLERFPTDAELADAYGSAESDDYLGEEAGQRETARVALERIERHAGRGSLLDLGCWVGFLMAEARARGWETLGVEPSDFASRHARERLGLDVIRDDLFTADLPSGAFDAVVLADVIEHLPRPADALDRIAPLLRPGGVLYLALPDAGSRLARRMGPRWWSVIPTHVHYFTRPSVLTLLRRRGYEPLWAGTAPKAFTLGYYLDRVGGYSKPLAAALVGAARATGAADRMWAPDFRDRMGVIARAPAARR